MRLNLSDLRTLALFNEKVDRLERNGFTKFVLSQETGIILHADENNHVTIKTQGPTTEEIDSFVLTFRYFIQDKEKIQINKLPAIYSKLSEHDQNQIMFRTLYKEHKVYQRSTSDPTILQNGKALSKKEILHTFIYGDLSHMDDNERTKYMGWMRHEINGMLMKNEFIMILANELNFLLDFQQLNDSVIIEEMRNFDVQRQFSLLEKAILRMLHTKARVTYHT